MSLVTAYIFEKLHGNKNQHEKEIDTLLKKLNEYKKLRPTDKKSITFIKIFNFFKNIIDKNTTEALNFISNAKIVNISSFIKQEGFFIPMKSLETNIEKGDFFIKSYNIIFPLKVSFYSSRIYQEGDITDFGDWQVITGLFSYESNSNSRNSIPFSDYYEIHFSSKGIERIDYDYYGDFIF